MKLEDIYSPIEADLAAVEHKIGQELKTTNGLIKKINRHLLSGRGKMLRPALVLLSAKSAGRVSDDAISLAAAIELIHATTLIHDDVIDSAATRRRKPAINSKWGNEISVLFGDYILSRALNMLARLERPEILKRLSSVTDDLCQGELKQIKERFNLKLSEGEYLSIIKGKTASLISACCELGGLLGGDGNYRAAFAKFGQDFGMAFQIRDDCLDIIGDETNLGKPLGQDLVSGELTMPVIYILKNAPRRDRKIVVDYIKSRNGYRLDAIKDIAERYNAIDYAMVRAGSYIRSAKNSLASLKESASKEGLLSLCDYALERKI